MGRRTKQTSEHVVESGSPPACSKAKRALDVCVAASGLVLAAPVLAVASFAVWLEDGCAPLYFQDRVGLGRTGFRLVKLRTMRTNAIRPEDMGQVRNGHKLVTRVGGLLRRSKLDELPQLWNVLAGDMSLVGPRPTIAAQVERYDATQARRLTVRPGLSGWAQVNGNTELSWEDRISLDVWYVDHWSMLLDLRILCQTLSVVFRGERPNAGIVEEARRHAGRDHRCG